jgi:hypothetical protein
MWISNLSLACSVLICDLDLRAEIPAESQANYAVLCKNEAILSSV